MFRYEMTLVSVLCLSFGARGMGAQLTDPLPDVPMGNVTVQLDFFTSGLPVEREFVTPVFTQRVGPTDLAVIPGSHELVVTNYGGTAFRLDASGIPDAESFLDLAAPESPSYNPQFEFGGAHGFTALAFHPGFAEPDDPGFGKFYTLEPETSGTGVADFSESTEPGDHHQDVLYEYTLPSPSARICDATCVSSKRELLRVTQPGWHHNLGDLIFDDDRLLYIASGDGSVAHTQAPFVSDNSQFLSTIFGKVLRIDPLGNNSSNGQYGVPADNPFVDGPGGNVDEIFAYGLRNPYRLEFDTRTKQLYASETGENSVESVEALIKGGNFGWNVKEGSFLYDKVNRHVSVDIDTDGNGRGDIADQLGLIEPVFEYDRGDGIAIVGAVPYQGDLVPSLDEKLVFADFSGKLFCGDLETGEEFRLDVNDAGYGVPFNIHSVNRDSDGEIYILGIVQKGETDFDGVILKVYAAPTVVGDVNGDGELDASDIDLLLRVVRENRQEPFFDLVSDGIVNQDDRTKWVVELAATYFGDANLDGMYNSQDLIDVLAAGEYEDLVAANSSWADGDWNGDGDFDSDDLILALSDGGYEEGPRTVVKPVPEPTSLTMFAIAFAILGRRRITKCPVA